IAALIGRPPVCRAAAVGDPDAAAGPQDRIERRHHAADGRHALNATADESVRIRFPVGDEYQAMLTQPFFRQLVQGLLVPHRTSLPKPAGESWSLRGLI